MVVLRLYKKPGLSKNALNAKFKKIQKIDPDISSIDTEYCFNIEHGTVKFDDCQTSKLLWILSDPLVDPNVNIGYESHFSNDRSVFEVGPRLNCSTPFSTNAVSVCKSIGLSQITRLEVSVRYSVIFVKNEDVREHFEKFRDILCDKMTECFYESPLITFDHGLRPQQWYYVDVLGRGESALKELDEELSLGFSDWDYQYYLKLFTEIFKRNPTNVECFDLAQSNSEHCRHWFFKGKLIVDGEEKPHTLLEMVMNTRCTSNYNNVISFSDNSSAIHGSVAELLRPIEPQKPSRFQLCHRKVDLVFTAETHNFPTAVSPFNGAATGTGGRIRDVQAVGRGGNPIGGTVGYCVGNLLIPGYKLQWEIEEYKYPSKFAKPLEILIEASNGASDYGNKFGEPVICGFTRSVGLTIEYGAGNRERKEYVKPILFSGGFGTIDSIHCQKEEPKLGMSIVKLGGPAYKIGIGGGAVSSAQVLGNNNPEADFAAVQRGDPEMEQKLNRVIRGCIELNEDNPILNIHDQGAGGNGNVLKELVCPKGGVVFTKSFQLGDNSLNTLELWGAEYQESNALLCYPEGLELLRSLSIRERCPFDEVGFVKEDGKITLVEDHSSRYKENEKLLNTTAEDYPVNLDLRSVLANIPQKTFKLNKSKKEPIGELRIPPDELVVQVLELVLKLLSVGSKRFLVNKVDRSVTGLIAQQQCVGPLHTPIADAAVTAISYNDITGIASSIGEQPVKAMVNPVAGARMSVAEAITNLAFVPITDIKDIKCSANWMWPASLEGEGVKLYDSCTAMCDIMKELGIAVDGGKDSLSMATKLDDGTIVKSPGTLVISTYAPCTDITKIVTPDIKSSAIGQRGILLHVNLSNGKYRLGGTAFSQCLRQLSTDVPDIEEPKKLATAFNIIQKLISDGKILSGHDISDGGVLTCILEMAFAGISGLYIDFAYTDPVPPSVYNLFFAEECGWILECSETHAEYVKNMFLVKDISCQNIGYTEGHGISSNVRIHVNQVLFVKCKLCELFSKWEQTSHAIEKEQMNASLADEEFTGMFRRKGAEYTINVPPHLSSVNFEKYDKEIAVAVLREEGINGDREMVAALHMAGFTVWDVTMQDLLNGSVELNQFRGLVFPGGFSYADVLGSGKGWAASSLFNSQVSNQFAEFYKRNDTFSFGVCNGCQLMVLLGWIGNCDDDKDSLNSQSNNVALTTNNSDRFESRFSTVRIFNSPSIMLKNMEESILGVWVAHKEGKFSFKNDTTYSNLQQHGCFPLRYVDDDGNPTTEYPLNPNGSPGGVAGICSINGRHLGLMPHPERCIHFWQWPYISPAISHLNTPDKMSPWFQMFRNAYDWCRTNDNN